MADPIDPERYLRLLAERTLLDGEPGTPWGGPVERAAAALTAVEVLDREVADAVVDEYALAAAVRGRGGPPGWRRQGAAPGSTATVQLRPVTVVPGPIEVTLPRAEITVRWVRFGEDDTAIGVTARLANGLHGSSGRFRRRPPFPPGGPLSLRVADDQGTAAAAGFSGGGGGDGLFQGILTTVPLSSGTAWLELDGQRIELPPRRPSDVSVEIEVVPRRSPALGYLWHEAALSAGPFPGPGPSDIQVPIEALVAVGAVDPQDPELDAVRQVTAAFGHRGRGAGPGTGAGSPLPEPWASLMASTSLAREGPSGIVPVGAVTPPVDGIAVAVDVVDVEPDGFSAEVVTAPGWGLHQRFLRHASSGLEWWAEDDRGGVHLGHVGSSNGGPDKMRATIQFADGLDAEATELRIIPTGLTERAIVRVPLPWSSTAPHDRERAT